jgi:DnaJ homolog subfamily A member 2
VDEAKYEESDLADVRARSFPAGSDFFSAAGYSAQFGEGDEEDWVDDEDEDEEGAEPECRQQ